MKLSKIIPICALAAAAIACDEGSSSNPATATRGDLNPPTGLISLTGDSEVTLRWLGNNTEDDFKGYHVLMGEGDFSSWTPAYPDNANLANGSVPRCAKNNAVFTKVGFPDSTSDCEGGTATEPAAGSSLQEDEEKPLTFVKCVGLADENVSAPATEKVLGMQSCKVPNLKNGTTYSFVVMAVMGSEFEILSWSSNFVSDTPSVSAFSSELTITAGNHLFLSHADLLTAVGGTKLTATNFVSKVGCPDEICRVNRTNSSANAGGIYFGRRGTADTYPARIFFSAPASKTTDAVMYLYRGGQTFDPQNPDTVATSVPGDEANSSAKETGAANFYTSGAQVEILGNEVIDIAIRKDSSWHFGKLVIDVPVLKAPVTASSDVTVKVTLIVQSTAGIPHYLQ